MQIVLLILSLIILSAIIYEALRNRKPLIQPSIEVVKSILEKYVLFYQRLEEDEKRRFESAVQKFLQKVHITGVKTVVEDMDSVLIAAAAIIPIFSFPDWEYRNINRVLLYPGSFNEHYQLEGQGRYISGMVGNGPMQYVMIISRTELRNGFFNPATTRNTAIHEFVHLLDKADGSIDGLPEALLPHQYALPWLQLIHREIQRIKEGNSDINPYAAYNEREFFAVTSEYFFKQPQMMQQNHPELYSMLEKMFKPI